MIPCRSCGRNAEFCGCAARRRRLVTVAVSWALSALAMGLAFSVGYLIHP